MSAPSRCAATNGSLECELPAGHDQGADATPHEAWAVAWCPWKTDAEMKAWADDQAYVSWEDYQAVGGGFGGGD